MYLNLSQLCLTGFRGSAKMSQFIPRDRHAERSSLRLSRRQGWPSCFTKFRAPDMVYGEAVRFLLQDRGCATAKRI
jgi:hypothetical protein